MISLRVPHLPYGTADELIANIRSARARNLPELPPALCHHDGNFVIAASGPSLPEHLDAIRDERACGRPICAVNGAHDFLVENGLEPDLFVTVDPRDTIIGNTKRKNGHTTYLIASRCSPALFDHLSDCKVMLWHSFCMEAEAAAFKGRMAIGGGTTSGTRAIYIGFILGFRNFVCYGMDSCLAADGVTKRFTGEKAGRTLDIIVGETGRRFLANYAMAQQADEVQQIPVTLPNAHIDFKGDGLLAAIWAERRRLGMPV